jgi:hypothetical protein
MVFGLRMTTRCWVEDFGYQPAKPKVADALEYLIVRDFVNTRRQEPDGHEGPVAALGVPYMKLKAGDRSRGVTLWDKRPQGRDNIQDPDLPYPGVVWLVASGYRKEGDADDAYEVFARLGVAGLAPKSGDYEHLYTDIYEAALEALQADFERALNELLERAGREPGIVHRADLEIAQLAVAIVVFDTIEYRVAIFPLLDSNRRPIPEDIRDALIQIVFKDARLDELEYPDASVLAGLGYEPGPFDLPLAQLRERGR